MFNEKQLRNAAREMNKVMAGLEPPLNVQGKLATLVTEIKEAITYIDPDLDKFTKATQEVIDELGGEAEQTAAEKIHDANVGKAPVNKGKKAPEPEEEEEEEEDEAEPEEEEEEEPEEEKPAPKPKKPAPKPKGTPGYVRTDAVCEALLQNPKTIEDWIKKANALMVKNGGKANDNENKGILKLVSIVVKHFAPEQKIPTA